MKLLITLISLSVSTFAATTAATDLDLVSLQDKFDEVFKQYPQNPELMEDIMTPDAVVCIEDDCSPYREVYDNWFEDVKTFDYMNEVRAVGKNTVSGRCWDYMDYPGGCHTMFYADWTAVFNADGKLTKHSVIMSQENMANAFKCMPSKLEVDVKGETK